MSQLDERIQVFEDDVLPRWARHFATLLLADLPVPEEARALDVACGMGETSLELLRRHGERVAQVMAVDESREEIEAVAARAGDLAGQKLFTKRDNLGERLAFPDGSFDLVLGCFGVLPAADNRRLIRELVRVARPGGGVAFAYVARNSLRELLDLFVIELGRLEEPAAARRVEALAESFLSPKQAQYLLETAGVSAVVVDTTRFTLEYADVDRFRQCPVWGEHLRPAVRTAVEDRKVFEAADERVGERVGRYTRRGAFEVSVIAASVRGEREA